MLVFDKQKTRALNDVENLHSGVNNIFILSNKKNVEFQVLLANNLY